MQAQEVLSYLHAEGLDVAPVPGKPNTVLVTPREAITDEHRRLIRTHKPELLSLLTRRPMPVPPLPPPTWPPSARPSQSALRSASMTAGSLAPWPNSTLARPCACTRS